MNRRDGLRTLAVAGLATAGLTVSGVSTLTAADIAPDKIPANIKEAAERLFKHAKWTSATKSKEDGEEIYELFGEDGKGIGLSVEITDGKVTSVERDVDLKMIPKAVMETLASKMPKFTPEHALVMYHGDDIRDLSKAEVTYQLNGPAGKSKDVTVQITAEGKFIETKREIELTELPKVVADAIAKKYPKFKAETAHSVRHEGMIVHYILTGAGGRIVTASPDGKELELHRDE